MIKHMIHKSILTVFVAFILICCLLPNAVYADSCPAGGDHVFKVTVKKQATETKTGIEKHTCKKCGYSYDYVTSKLGHDFSAWKTKREAGCVNSGSLYRKCNICGKIEYKSISPTGTHEFGEWKVTSEPTEHREGIEQRDCALCGFVESRTIPMVEADPEDPDPIEPEPEEPEVITSDPTPGKPPANDPLFNLYDIVIATVNAAALGSYFFFIRRDVVALKWYEGHKAKLNL